ncbi:MAG TPA: lysophospholipid acyltransferase family protein [Kofleriaceae bacterium]|jgi:1-acyl-sn-glycerol-3-phosphate acyltransferase|nr:lysophospholipid acyltransferase family protein [Kofleriaceae bacterium]
MSLLDSVRVLGAMARVTAPTLVEAARGSLARSSIDERTRWFGRRVIELLEIDLIASGAELVPPRAVIYMSNHQSHLDIPVLYASLPSPTIRMLAKTELFQIPLWGPGLRAAEFIEVDRKNHMSAMRSIDHAARLIRDGVSIYLAPEGTRSRDGRIGKLKKGGFHLALGTGAPIVPVAIRGTLGILPRGAKVMRSGQQVTVQIGAPIDVAGRDIDGLITQVGEFLVNKVEN